MVKIKMFYINTDVDKDEKKVNTFLEEIGKDFKEIQMVSSVLTGGDTVDTIMVVYEA